MDILSNGRSPRSLQPNSLAEEHVDYGLPEEKANPLIVLIVTIPDLQLICLGDKEQMH
jgi:hypothetical protein